MMNNQNKTTLKIEALVNAPVEKTWQLWNSPDHVRLWNTASADWHTTTAVNDLCEGGKFTYRMEAKDGSFGFDFTGTYVEIIPNKKLVFVLEDERKVVVLFEAKGNATHVVETFEAEHENPLEMQQAGWQSILNNFKQYTETHS